MTGIITESAVLPSPHCLRPKKACQGLGRYPSCWTSCLHRSQGNHGHFALIGAELVALGPKISRYFLEHFFTGVAR